MTVSRFYMEVRDRHMKSFAFPSLKKVNELAEGQSRTFDVTNTVIDRAGNGAKCVNINTCAALIIFRTFHNSSVYMGDKCFVYHAPGGKVSEDILVNARIALNVNDFNNCILIYAHPNEQGKYKDDITKICNSKLVLHQNLVVLSNIPPSFGVQSNGVIGF